MFQGEMRISDHARASGSILTTARGEKHLTFSQPLLRRFWVDAIRSIVSIPCIVSQCSRTAMHIPPKDFLSATNQLWTSHPEVIGPGEKAQSV